MAICTFSARTLASEACIEDLMMQARKIEYDVIGLTEARRHRPLHAVFENGKELFFGKCDSRGVGGVGVVVSTHLAMNIDSQRKLNNPNRTFAIKKMWLNSSSDHLRCLRTIIERRGVGSILHGPGGAL
ncbi:unnamed protein product [Haemonchus placei]|uniref:Endo/exonuclease/phosphatase domain-containing protein n=1 Tax=Haemonchus placei TaxID=6290 RepID=A0A0N4X396_HAEPC|nr:unnamed protein product [Haemonchus placei]